MILSNLAKDAAIYGSGDLVGKLIAFITFPMIAASLSPKAFGVLDLIMTGVGLMSLVIGCGLSNSAQRYYWEKENTAQDRADIVSTGLFIQIVFGLIFIAIGFLLTPILMNYLTPQDLPLTWIAIAAAFVLTPATQLLQYIQDTTRLQLAPWKFLTISLIVRSLTALFALVAVVHFHGGVDQYILVVLCVSLLALPLGLWMIRKDVVFKINKSLTLTLLHYGYPFIFVIFAHWLFGSMDRWMLASMSSIDETGIYGVSFRFSALVLFVSTAFGQAWSPNSMKIRADHPEKYPEICGMVLLFLLYIVLIAGGGLALFSGEIIGYFMPIEYADAALPLAVLSFAIVFQATIQVTAVGISLSKKTYIFANLAWVTAAFNFAGNLILIPDYGALGAALATLGSYILLTGAYLFYTQRLQPVVIFWKKLGWLFFLGGIIAMLSIVMNSHELNPNLIALKLICAVVCLCLGALVLPFKDMKKITHPA